MSKRTMSVEYCCLRKGCNYVEELYVDPQDFFDWDNGKPIQDAMPYLNASQRELMISHTCDECWEKMYGE